MVLPAARSQLTVSRPLAEVPAAGAWPVHFESTCYDPLLLFNREGDCQAAKLRPGNVHSAGAWEELVLPEIQRLGAAGWCSAVPTA